MSFIPSSTYYSFDKMYGQLQRTCKIYCKCKTVKLNKLKTKQTKNEQTKKTIALQLNKQLCTINIL